MSRLKITLLLSAVVSMLCCPPDKFVATQSCSCKHNEVTCKSKHLSLNQTVHHLKNLAFSPFKKLILKDMRLETINLQELNGIYFAKLDVIDCRLDGMVDSMDLPFLNGIKIENSIFEPLISFRLKLHKISKLLRLNLKKNAIKIFKTDWFPQNLQSLVYLSLTDNDAEGIEEGAFSYLVNLKTINLSRNRLKLLKRAMFPVTVKYLEQLDLSNNKIENMPENFFYGMSSLMHLDLRHNLIKDLPLKTWNPIWSTVKTISLKKNLLDCSLNIEWMAKSQSPILDGTCFSPEERKGRLIISFINNLRCKYAPQQNIIV